MTNLEVSNDIKYFSDGKVAVLYSPGYGAGWYTWNSDYPQLLFHKDLVELVLAGKHKEITEDLVKNICGETIYLGGVYDLTIEWLDPEELFYIYEYDGNEYVVTSEQFFKA